MELSRKRYYYAHTLRIYAIRYQEYVGVQFNPSYRLKLFLNKKMIIRLYTKHICIDGWTLVAIVISILVALMATWKFWVFPGYIYLFEEFEVFTPQHFLDVAHSLWNEQLGRHSFNDRFKLYYYLFLYAIGEAFTYKVLQGLALALPIALSFLSAYLLTRYLTKSPKAALIAAFIYTINPWVATNPRNILHRIEYALFPLLFLLQLKYLETNKRKYMVYAALVLGTIYTVRSWVLYAIYSTVLLLLHILVRRNVKQLSILFVHPLALALAAPRVLPPLYYVLAVPQYNLSTFMETPATPLEYLTTYQYLYPGALFNLTYSDPVYLLFGLIVAATIPALLFNKDHRALYFAALYVVGFLLSTHPINTGIWIVDRLLRAGYWNAMIAPLVVAVATGYLIKNADRRGFGIHVGFVLVVTAAVSAWPILTGDMAGYWHPAPPPTDYLTASQLLKNATGLVLWLPYMGDPRAVWSAQRGAADASAPTGIVEVLGIGAPAIEWRAYYPLQYFNPLNGTFVLQPFSIYTGNLSRLYTLMGIQYIGIVYDRQWPQILLQSGLSNQRLREVAARLTAEGQPYYVGQYLALIKLSQSVGCAVRRPLFCLCDLPEMARILSAFDYTDAPAVILPQPGLNITYILKNSYVYAQNNTELELYVASHLPGSRLIAPFFLISSVDPREKWAKAPLAAYAILPDFLNYLYRKGVREWPWQSDYGYGLVYTESVTPLALSIVTETDSVLAVRALKCSACGTAEVYVDGRPIATIRLQSNTTSFTWLLLTELTPGRHRIEIKPKGLTVINVVAAIPKTNIMMARHLLAETCGVEQLDRAPPGTATCRKETPTRWTLTVNATEEPAVVVLPVPYDPLWSAEDEKAVAVYGVNVGFYVKTGRYEVSYQLEIIFHVSVVLAVLAVLLLAYLARKT